MGPISLQPQVLGHPDDQPSHHPYKPRAVVSANETEKKGKRLNEDYVGDVQEIGLRKGMLQAKTILEIEVGFGGAKVGHDLPKKNDNTVLSHVCSKHGITDQGELTSSSSMEVIAA